jgi:hypothetical protein
MSISMIDALGIRKKTPNLPQKYQRGDKQVKPPCVHMNLPLFHRRKTMLVTYYSGRLNPTALKQMSLDFGCSEKALLNDWVDRGNWEPFIWESEQANKDGKDLLNQLQLAREEALYLMKTCKVPNARVGAIARFTEAIKTEIELKQSLGLLPRAKVEPSVNVEVNVANKTEHVLLAEYAGVISEAATLNSNLSRVRVGESLDSKSSSSSDGKERSDS